MVAFTTSVGSGTEPVPVINGVVAFAIGKLPVALTLFVGSPLGSTVVVAFAELIGPALIVVEVLLSVMGAEWVWTSVVPLVVQVVVYVV